MKNRLLLLLLCVAGAWIAARAACDGTGSSTDVDSNCGGKKQDSKYYYWDDTAAEDKGKAYTVITPNAHKNCGNGRMCLTKSPDYVEPYCESCWNTIDKPTPLKSETNYFCRFLGTKSRQGSTMIWKDKKSVLGKNWIDCFNSFITPPSWAIFLEDKKTIMCGRCNEIGCGPCTIAN